MIHEDQSITTKELALPLSISYRSTQAIIHKLEYSEVCTKWVPRNLTLQHKTERIAISSELLQCFEGEGEIF
jgi:Mn-dependent DtxR family transcriptional regulator